MAQLGMMLAASVEENTSVGICQPAGLARDVLDVSLSPVSPGMFVLCVSALL